MSNPSRHAPSDLLRYKLSPAPEARLALEETLAAYRKMLDILSALPSEGAGANLVMLHELAYETIREQTGLPARLVTLGLRDFASHRHSDGACLDLPLDEKLFAIKGPSTLTIATLQGRVSVPFDVAGYSNGWTSIFPAYLTTVDGRYEVHIGVTRNSPQTEENTMNESILSRMGRLIAGLANAAVDKAEGVSKIAVIEQAIREIDVAADEARTDLGKARAEEYRIGKRRTEIAESIKELEEKIRMAISSAREDLAKAGIARQIDLESQIAAIDKALADAGEHAAEAQKALQAILATRREAEERLADFKRSLVHHPTQEGSGRANPQPTIAAARAAAAVSRMTGVPAGKDEKNAELDELDRLHREQAIEERLARFKTGLQ